MKRGEPVSYESKLKDPFADALFEAVLALETVEECYRFFEDICTIKEVQSISQRLAVARLLKEGKTYSEIEKTTGASTATISRVNRCLLYGADGYQLILKRLNDKQESDKQE
ncbi:YerC/YecD family TrpR-related protein [Anoxynatronum buryatiense]|uniref:Trp operon repressor family n=1 Tax=Anoxynatronum buryatiense TaxID=489973 RepID=A0AA45WYS6_9CLOT|nr:YerC/YecD family TrpR-related protein [Anoxynatronum buryatiense]SMP68191.1 Trp operon repressor family [Anoxynatronum buryatiense]